MSSLLRTQVRLAVIVLVALGVLVGGLPLLFPGAITRGRRAARDAAAVGAARVRRLPGVFGLGWFYVRPAERNERDFADVVERVTR